MRDAAARAYDDGDYARAIELWEGWLKDAPAEGRQAGQLELARACLADGRYDAAIEALLPLADGADAQTEVLALLVQAYQATDQWAALIDAYRRYLSVEDAAAPYVLWHIAQAQNAMGDHRTAAETLATIDLDDVGVNTRAEILEEWATQLDEVEDHDGALAVYDRILGLTRNASYQAILIHRRGEMLLAAGREAEARAVFQQVVSDYETTLTAHLALRALDDLGPGDGDTAPAIDDLKRGRILFHGRQYAASAEALERYVVGQPESDLAEAHYWLGRARARSGQYAAAYDAYDVVIRDYPNHELARSAWMAKAAAVEAQGEDPSGLYHEYWVRFPGDVRAPEALWSGGQALMEAQRWPEARAFFRLLRSEYPQDSGAAEAAFREGLAAYASGAWTEARDLWAAALAGEQRPDRGARLALWLGLAEQRLGRDDVARAHWRDAEDKAPRSYYGLRARDLARGQAPLLPPTTSSAPTWTAVPVVEWEAARVWVATWHSGASTDAAMPDLTKDRRVARALSLWQLGLQSEANALLREVRDALRSEPAALLALTRLSHEHGIHSLAISSADLLMRDGRTANAADPPLALMHIAYPAAYSHLVDREAQTYPIDPLLFLALVRQESRFDAHAVSYAGATGLTQVMPQTGEWIATRLDIRDYSHDLLTRPTVSVRFGMWFLHFLLDRYGRDWIASLVAYNAGPGNLERWTDGGVIADHDLFFELIPIKQAQDYVRYIYEQYRMYESIYRTTS